MSQEFNENNRRSKRAARAHRHRPTLVTGQESEQTPRNTDKLAVEVAPLEQEPAVAPKSRKLPSFFSSIGKKEEQKQEAVIAEARLARATRKAGTSAPAAEKAGKTEKSVESPPKTTKVPAKPASPFKTRYIIGMALYLIVAEVIGTFEQGLMHSVGWDIVLTKFSLFGGQIIISTSTLAFLATLIIILVVLARLDLIPRNLAALGGSPTSRAGQTKSEQESPSVKTPPSTMKQGVQGADDKLYQAYRSNQRKKRQ